MEKPKQQSKQKVTKDNKILEIKVEKLMNNQHFLSLSSENQKTLLQSNQNDADFYANFIKEPKLLEHLADLQKNNPKGLELLLKLITSQKPLSEDEDEGKDKVRTEGQYLLQYIGFDKVFTDFLQKNTLKSNTVLQLIEKSLVEVVSLFNGARGDEDKTKFIISNLSNETYLKNLLDKPNALLNDKGEQVDNKLDYILNQKYKKENKNKNKNQNNQNANSENILEMFLTNILPLIDLKSYVQTGSISLKDEALKNQLIKFLNSINLPTDMLQNMTELPEMLLNPIFTKLGLNNQAKDGKPINLEYAKNEININEYPWVDNTVKDFKKFTSKTNNFNKIVPTQKYKKVEEDQKDSPSYPIGTLHTVFEDKDKGILFEGKSCGLRSVLLMEMFNHGNYITKESMEASFTTYLEASASVKDLENYLQPALNEDIKKAGNINEILSRITKILNPIIDKLLLGAGILPQDFKTRFGDIQSISKDTVAEIEQEINNKLDKGKMTAPFLFLDSTLHYHNLVKINNIIYKIETDGTISKVDNLNNYIDTYMKPNIEIISKYTAKYSGTLGKIFNVGTLNKQLEKFIISQVGGEYTFLTTE